ncbi:uncharacterized protein LOC130674150 [Microplitis mediator]|uniref:uncharacterized protein LOC130674150 n=1 Tax=Microplitis mediator TaxID=375433 RepID=UPI002553C9C0|nr:uncharacterized protein LOC130674150 [Microplitis mediator]
MEHRSAKELNHILTTVLECLNALKALGCSTHTWDDLIEHDVVQLLDFCTEEAGEINLGSSTESPTYDQLKTFLTGSARALESMESQLSPPKSPTVKNVSSSSASKRSYSQSAQRTPPAHVHLANTEPQAVPDLNNHCSACQQAHYIAFCPSFSLLCYNDKMDIVRRERLCFNCLGRHNLRKCKIPKDCKICDERHHTLLHQGPKATLPATTAPATTQAPSPEETSSTTSTA